MSSLLEVEDLSVRYGGVLALCHVDLTVEAGTIAGLIGPNGAGKTSCIDALTGFHAPATGTVAFDGRDITSLAPHRRTHLGFRRTFQGLDLFEDLSVRQNLTVAASTPTWRDTLADAFRLRRRLDPAVDETLGLVGISHLAERFPTGLSNGQRRMVALAQALVSRPRLLLLDEPAAGLDEDESVALGGLLRRLPDLGVTVLLVDHDMSLVLGVCDRVHVLDFGSLITSGTPAEVRSDPRVVAAYLGTSGKSDPAPNEDATDP